jgi:hypothetical protein
LGKLEPDAELTTMGERSQFISIDLPTRDSRTNDDPLLPSRPKDGYACDFQYAPNNLLVKTASDECLKLVRHMRSHQRLSLNESTSAASR